jgi:hypothetical protein
MPETEWLQSIRPSTAMNPTATICRPFEVDRLRVELLDLVANLACTTVCGMTPSKKEYIHEQVWSQTAQCLEMFSKERNTRQ